LLESKNIVIAALLYFGNMGNGRYDEFRQAIETDHDGSIFVTKQQPTTTPPQIRDKLQQSRCGNLATYDDADAEGSNDGLKSPHQKCNPDHHGGGHLTSSYVDESNDASVTSLELLTIVAVEDDCGEKSRLQQLCGKRFVGYVLLASVLLVLAIVLPMTLKKNDDNNRDKVAVSDGAGRDIDFVSYGSSIDAYNILMPLVANPDALLDPSTVEGQAFLDVENEHDPFDIQQLYALQMLYYSTAGESWVFNHGWESDPKRRRRRNMRRSLADTSLCQWAGIAICRNQGNDKYAVAGLDLSEQ
jgi:hypothetical protein